MKTINLLPKSKQKELRYEALYKNLVVICVLTLISFAAVFALQIGAKFYIQYQAGSIKSQIAALQMQVDKEKKSDVETQVTAANNLIADYTSLTVSSPKWSKVIAAFVPLVPESVRINSFNVGISDKTVTINGISPTRDLVIQLYNNVLNDQKDFYNIDYPLENVVLSKNVNFHFTFYIQNKLLQ